MGLTPPKKLIDLTPEWAEVDGRFLGIWFECPKCGQLAAAWFANPPDGGPPRQGATWGMQGNDFGDMTLTPSLRLGCCGWHGHITDGVAIDSGQP